MKKATLRLNAAFVTVLALAGTLLMAPQLVASTVAAHAVIGMPFTGKWAYDVNVNPPYTDQNSSHPSVHHTPGGGHWATDLYGAEGQPVKLLVPHANGALSFSRAASSTSCGQSIRINVFVDGASVGWLYFAHLNNVPGGALTNGMAIGTVHSWGCNPGRHVHVEFRNTTNHSCYADHGHPGSTVSEGEFLGILGSSNTSPQQQCASTLEGTDTFGSYNSATATFYISNAMTPSVAEATFMYGNSGWAPLVGDWDGNGTDTFGSYNPATATFYISNAMTPSVAEATFMYGNSGWAPLVGDWDGQ